VLSSHAASFVPFDQSLVSRCRSEPPVSSSPSLVSTFSPFSVSKVRHYVSFSDSVSACFQSAFHRAAPGYSPVSLVNVITATISFDAPSLPVLFFCYPSRPSWVCFSIRLANDFLADRPHGGPLYSFFSLDSLRLVHSSPPTLCPL